VNSRSASSARAFISIATARSTIQALACRQLPSPKLTKLDSKQDTVQEYFVKWKVGYSRRFCAFSTTATLFQVQTSSKVVIK